MAKFAGSGAISLAILATCGGFSRAQDDSVWINAGIQTAIANGESSYTIPAGNYQLLNAIVIPPSVHNFTLQGAGSTLTHFTASTADLAFPGYAIIAGQQVLLNNWGLTNCEPGYAVNSVSSGATELTIANGTSPLVVGDYLVLLDSNAITTCVSPYQSQLNRAELAKVIAVGIGTITLDKPAARNYTASPMVYRCSDLVSTGVAIEGMSFDGTVTGTTIYNNGIVNLDLTDEFTLSDLVVTNFDDRAIQTDVVRNGTVTNLNLSLGSDIDDPGDGYGLTFCRSRFVNVANSIATSTRHAFICTNGSTDIAFSNCTAVPLPSGVNDFNTHGFDEQRISYTNCTGNFQFANPGWLGGAENITVANCSGPYQIYFGPNSSNCTVTNSSFPSVEFDTHYGSTGSPNKGWASNIIFKGCNFIGQNGRIIVNNQANVASFYNCFFEQTDTSWGTNYTNSSGLIGTMIFSGCEFVNDSIRNWDYPFELEPGQYFEIKVLNCSFYSKSGALAALDLEASPVNLYVTGCSFYSLNPKQAPTFFANLTDASTLTNMGNTASVITSWMLP
jgi:hypothetical protein